MRKLLSKLPPAARPSTSTAESALSPEGTRKDITYQLEVAVTYGSMLARMAGVAFNLDPENTDFNASPERGLTIIDRVLYEIKANKALDDEDTLRKLIERYRTHIRDMRHMRPEDYPTLQEYEAALYKRYFHEIIRPFEVNPFLDYLTDRIEKNTMLYGFMGDRDLLLRYLKVASQLVFLYVLSKEDSAQYGHCLNYILQKMPDKGSLITETIAQIPAYRQYW